MLVVKSIFIWKINRIFSKWHHYERKMCSLLLRSHLCRLSDIIYGWDCQFDGHFPWGQIPERWKLSRTNGGSLRLNTVITVFLKTWSRSWSGLGAHSRVCVGMCTNVWMPMGTPEVGIPIGTAGDGCWLDSSQSNNGWMERGATHLKLVPRQILSHNVPKLIRVIMVLCVSNKVWIIFLNKRCSYSHIQIFLEVNKCSDARRIHLRISCD